MPPPTLWQRLAAIGQRLRDHVAGNSYAWSLFLLVVLAAVRFRAHLVDGVDSLRWRLTRRGSAGTHLLATLWLVERRGRRAGLGRPKGVTTGRWLSEDLAPRVPAVTGELAMLRRWIDEALYSPDGFSKAAAEVHPVSRRVVETLSAAWFRERAAASLRSRSDERTTIRS